MTIPFSVFICEIKFDPILKKKSFLFMLLFINKPASMAQLDACPTGDQKAAGLTPAGSATFFCGDFDHEIVSTVILSLPLIQERQLSGERRCIILVNR